MTSTEIPRLIVTLSCRTKLLTLGNTQINLTASNFIATHPIKNEFLLGFAAQKFGISLA